MRSPLFIRVHLWFLLLWLFVGLCTHHGPGSWNDRSRLAAVESLVERGTFRIDAAMPRFHTGDKIFRDGHLYSDKLPTLQVIAAGLYAGLYHGLGLSFSTHLALCYWLLTWLLVGSSAAGVGVLGMLTAREHGLPGRAATVLGGLLLFGTLIFSYSGTFNAHVPTAFLLLLGLRMLLRLEREGGLSRPRLLLWGFTAALAGTFEAPAGGLFWLLFLGAVVFEHRLRGAALFLAGSLPPLGVHFTCNYLVIGSLRPSYLYPELWRVGHGMVKLTENFEPKTPLMVAEYLGHSLFSTRSLFFLTPLLLCGLAGLVWAVRRPAGIVSRRVALICLIGVLGTIIYYSTQTTSYGGIGYGIRYYLSLSPALWLGTLGWWSRGGRWLRGALVLAAAWSVLTASVGAVQPWPLRPVPLPAEAPALPPRPSGWELVPLEPSPGSLDDLSPAVPAHPTVPAQEVESRNTSQESPVPPETRVP
jgi:hypothetical protein